jgi:hypothetical protein
MKSQNGIPATIFLFFDPKFGIKESDLGEKSGFFAPTWDQRMRETPHLSHY